MKASEASSTAKRHPASPGSSAARPERFRLTGPSARPDPRIHAWRGDIADVALAGILFAPHYAAPSSCTIGHASIMVRDAAAATASAVSQLVYGETFHILDSVGGWAWGFCDRDHYVGYVPRAALVAPVASSHHVVAITAPVFAAANMKAAVCASLPIGAKVAGRVEGDFLATAGGYLHHRHIRPIEEMEIDPVAVARRLLGQPYLWGGRGAGGIDCSGLVQRSLGLCGIAAPRDSDMQRDDLGTPLAAGDALRRGDLMFFPGHVGMMTDGTSMIHATAHTMTVAIEPLADVVARLAPSPPRPILASKRL